MVKLKNVAKVAGGGLLLAGGGAAAALAGPALVAAKLEQKKVEKTTYNINSWGPLSSDPSKVSLKYSPALAFAKSDKLTVSGTPFDGEYTNPVYRTRNEVYITPAAPVTQSGTGGTFKVKTSVIARAKGGFSATKAGARTGAKKTGKVIKKGAQAVGRGIGKASGWLWNKIKWYVYGAIFLALLAGAGYLFFQYKARQALMGAAAPTA